ncbi:thiamine phosphate synthase [Enterococcus nangangensis]|uniref:thiamine phosphate synthase n=1 Tax=Enterococcus nangangensis TaxID=2559926 RepID=UPI0010F565F4|nr:thiamine phosphate synthase [Enterococcus nangangensis]
MSFTKKNLLLYGVTDRAWLGGRTLAECVEAAILGGVTCIQLREKHLAFLEFVALAKEIQVVCRKYHVPLIINDNLAVAEAVDADGLHVGQDDLNVAAIKAQWPGKIVGVSAQTVAQALQAEKEGADYLGVGAVFATDTKADAVAVPLATLQAITAAVTIPVCAIGGIHRQNIAQLYTTGIDGVALVSEIFQQQDIQENAQALRQLVAPFKQGGSNA